MTSSFFLGCLVCEHRIGFIEDCFQHRAWGRPVTRPEAPIEWVPCQPRWRSPPSRQLIHVLMENTISSSCSSVPSAPFVSESLFQMCFGKPFRLRHHIGPTPACPGPIDGEGEGRALLSSRSEGSFTVAEAFAKAAVTVRRCSSGFPGKTRS